MPTPTITRPSTLKNHHFLDDLGDGILLDMVLVRGGTFMMGSPEEEEGRYDDEGPQHEVTVPTFFMGRYPVTQAQWQRVASFDRIEQDLDPNPSEFRDREDSDTRPVETVSWSEAKEFCARLSAHTRRHYRLPTEAEWEYACRGGTTTPFYCGESITTDIANYDGDASYGPGATGIYRGETTPVESFRTMANSLGLCDLHGNVWEWCEDHWHDDYVGAPLDGSAWLENTPQSNNRDRVSRGGSWGSDPRFCRSAYRDRVTPGGRASDLGFRVVLAPQ